MKPERRYYGRLRKALCACHNEYELKDSIFKEAFWNKTLRNIFPHVHGASFKWTPSVIKLKPVCTFYVGTFGSNPRTTDDIRERI